MEQFFKKMREMLGDEFPTFEYSFTQEAYRGIRLNKLKSSYQTLQKCLPFALDKVPFCADGYYLPSDVSGIGNHPLHCAGAFYVQEPSAMSAVTMLDVQQGDYVLDLCAAPGGKSTQIADALCGGGLLWSNEIVKSRANILLSNIERLGVRNAVVSSCHPQDLCSHLGNFFDKILVDAPCSGEGMFRKDKNAISEWTLEHSISCANRQLQILQTATTALKSGGVIVYSTCTFSHEENEGVINKFLQSNPDFELVDSGEKFGRNTLDFAKRIFPMDGGEGHFAAKLKHKGEYSGQSISNTANNRKPDKAILEMYDNVFCNRPFGENLTVIGDKIIALPNGMPNTNGLLVLRAGVLLGEIFKNRVEPSHSAFMAAKPSDCRSVVDLDINDIRVKKFLSGEQIEVNDALRGFTAVCVEGVTVGFGKVSNGVLKNKYPKGLRINL